MRFILVILLSFLIFWWINHRENIAMIDVINCAFRRGTYNHTSKKCNIINFSFAIYNTTKFGTKEYVKINMTSKKELKRKVGF